MAKLTILQLNDLHGYIEPHHEMIRRDGGNWEFATLGGLARIATLFDSIRSESEVIALDNGDTFHGTHVAVASKGMALVPAMNVLQFDAMTVHWEFAFGPDGIQQIGRSLDYPMLAINCHRKRDDQLFLKPYTMVERSGLRVAIIGLACPIVDKTMPKSFSEGLYFTNGDQELPRWISHVRSEESADLIVVLSHLGFPQDVALARKVDGIDVLVSGHTHNRMDKTVQINGALLFQSGCHGSFIGRLDLGVEGGKIVSHRHQLIPVDDEIPPEARMAALVDAATETERQAMTKVVGETRVALHRYAMLNAPMDDLLTAAIARSASTTIAFSNGWRYGAPIPPGPITLGDLWNVVPMNPEISTTDLTGAEIREMLEGNLERTFAAEPFDQMGGYVKRMAGVRAYIKSENPAGHRIDRLYVEGAPVDEQRTYNCAFITEQGVPSQFGTNRRKIGIRTVDALQAILAEPWLGLKADEQSVREI